MKKIKIIVDIMMYIIFIILMGHHITDNLIHEILGISIFILFIIHGILNYRYYKTIFKGKYNKKRTIILITNILLLISMLCMIISAINISSDIFKFLNISPKIWGRKLHMLSTSWGFIFMSVHVGLHLNILINKLNKKLNKYIYYLLVIIMITYGIYSFIKLNLISDMFLLNPFKYYNFNEQPIIYYI